MHPLSGPPSLPHPTTGLHPGQATRREGPAARDHKHGHLGADQPLAATGARTPLSTRDAQVISGAAMQAVARAIAAEDLRRGERLAANGCAAKLRKLGASLPYPPPSLIVRGMTDQVADLLATVRYHDCHQLVDVLVAALGGAATMDPATLRIVTARLLSVALRVEGPSLQSGLRALCCLMGGPAMAAVHRRALLDAGLDVLAPVCQAHGLDPLDTAQRPVRISGVLLCALTDATHTAGDPAAHLDAIVAHLVTPSPAPAQPPSARLLARAAMLQGLCVALAQRDGPASLGAAYLALLARAPAFDAALYEHATDRFVFAELLRDQPTPEGAVARIRAFAQGVARWAQALDAKAQFALTSGTCNSLYNDSPFTPDQFGALVHGLLDAVPPDRSGLLASLAFGLLEPAAHRRQLGGGHVAQLLSIAEARCPSTAGDARREVLVLTLADALSKADWPAAPMRALVDGLLAHARGPADWITAGLCLGRCLATLKPTTSLFAQVLGRLVRQPDLASACQLLAGFFSSPGIAPSDMHEFEAITRILAPPTTQDAWRAATLAAQFAVALGAHRETGTSPRRMAPYFGKAGAGREAKGAPGEGIPGPLRLGLGLAKDPVGTVRDAGGSASQQLERLDRACQVQNLLDAERLHQQVRRLALEEFGVDRELRADMLATLFAYHAPYARPKTVLAARAALLRDHDLASDDASCAPPRARLDGKRMAAADLGSRDHLRTVLDAIYRDYVTGASPFAPSPQLEERLTWLESVLDPASGGIVQTWERELVGAIRSDYADGLAPALLAVPAGPHPA